MVRSLVSRIYLSSLLFLCSYVQASLGPTTEINNNGNIVEAPPISCFGTQTNQFFVTWISNFLYGSLYDTNGALVAGPLVLVDSSVVIPYTLPASCYNSTAHQFLISYLADAGGIDSACFNILDASGVSVVGPIAINPGSDQVNSLVFCAYNSTNNEYCLAWGSQGDLCYFALIDALGTILVNPTVITGSVINTNAGYNLFVSYNPTDNQYCFTWQESSDNNPYFALYNADGTLAVSPTLISNAGNSLSLVLTSSFNSVNDQYLIAWNDINHNGYFATINAAGVTQIAAMQFASTINYSNAASVFSAYNPQSNHYLLTWQSTDNNSEYTVVDASGNILIQPTDIPNLAGVTDFGFVTSSYGAGEFLIAWLGFATTYNGYFALLDTVQVNPPTNVTGCSSGNSFIFQQDALNTLTWSAPLIGSSPVSYEIYQDADLTQLIAIVSAAGPLTYTVHNRNVNGTYTYYIVSVDQNGDRSTAAQVTVTQPC